MESHPGQHYRQLFKKCSIRKALDGSEDYNVWEDDVEDDSDWVESVVPELAWAKCVDTNMVTLQSSSLNCTT